MTPLDELDVVLPAGLPRGTVALADREWLTVGGGSVPALSFAPDGSVHWCGGHLGQITAGADPTAVAGRALLRIARDAAAAAVEGGRGAVEVVGRGLVAARVRQLVGDGGVPSDEAPAAVVDTTGDPVLIRSALDRVADLGTIVLAGESAGRELDVDLYSSVHRRGLVVVGVASPLADVDDAGADWDEEDLAEWRRELVEVPSGGSVPGDALWYRFEA